MRHYLSLLLMLGVLSPSLKVLAVENPATPFREREIPDFWIPAQELVQQQIYLIPRIERALIGPDPNQVRLVRGQIFLHASSVDRLLKSYYPFASLLCGPTLAGGRDELAPVASLTSVEQARVYCYIYASTQKLDSLRSILDRRLAMLDSVAEVVEPLPLVTGEGRRDLSVPATPRLSSIPDLSVAEPPLIGTIPKQPIADFTPPFPPAIAPPAQAIATLDNAKAFLAQARNTFPPGTPFNEPDELAMSKDFLAIESQAYANFLALPNTGIARIFNAELYRQDPNIIRNRLLPTPAELFPFPLLFKPNNPESSFIPRLEIEIADNNLQVVQRELNYGFIVDLGDIPIENINENLSIVPSPTRQTFLGYRPPDKLEPLQEDRRRFITGKQQYVGVGQPVLDRSPVVLNHTYLLRTFQFQLPEFVITGEPLNRNQRRNLQLFLEAPSADLLVAFRPVYRRADGTYTVVWRVLKQFPNPQIEDLENYIDIRRSVE